MAQTSARVTVRYALLDALQAHDDLTGVQVEEMHPGDAKQRELVFLGATRPSESDIPTMKAGRKQLNDEFLIDVHFEATKGYTTARDGLERIAVLMAALEDVLLDDPQLGLDQSESGLLSATPTGDRNGPDPYRTKEGIVAYGRIAVECRTRLSP